MLLEARHLYVEEGATKSYGVRLTSQPSAPVRVSASVESGSEGLLAFTGGVQELTFSTSNWYIPQSLSVFAVENAVETATAQYYANLVHEARSTDTTYCSSISLCSPPVATGIFTPTDTRINFTISDNDVDCRRSCPAGTFAVYNESVGDLCVACTAGCKFSKEEADGREGEK